MAKLKFVEYFRVCNNILLRETGVSIALLRQILGHADGTTTMDIYCHDSNEFDAKDRRKIEEGLRGLGLRNG